MRLLPVNPPRVPLETRLDLTLTVGAREARIVLHSSGAAIAIVGPSGIGKTTLLRAIAGLSPRGRGQVVLRGGVHQDDAQDIFLAPHLRRIGWVPQDARLFPHLSVRENVAFGARTALPPIHDALAIGALLDRSPGTLSGGERQRVAIARALASEPHTLLLDEPLVALDSKARSELAQHITEHCEARGILRIVVAHDETDLSALTDERFEMTERGIDA